MAVGVLLLLFGVRWLAKAVARGAALKPLHDEDVEFAATRVQLASGERMADGSLGSRAFCSKAWRSGLWWSLSLFTGARELVASGEHWQL